MTTTTKGAKDQMFALVQAQADILEAGLRIEWQGVPHISNTPPSQEASWWSVTLKHDPSEQRQASLSCEHNQRRWRREGYLFVQCFAPTGAGGPDRAMEMACALRDEFQKTATSGGVWFRRVSAHEVGPSEGWFQANMQARFLYDEVK